MGSSDQVSGGKLVKKAFNTKNGEFAEVGAAGTGVTSKTFEKGKS